MICARSGSKKFPGKNLAEINGKPLIWYSIKAAAESKLLDRFVVSTNSETIAAVARSYGLDVPFLRPQEYATDTAKIEFALGHALGFYEEEDGGKYDIVVLLQNTSPLRTADHIDGCVQSLRDNWAFVDSSATVHLLKHPHMLRTYTYGHLLPLKDGWDEVYRRQDAPVVYMINGLVFAVKRDYLLEAGRVIARNCAPYVVPHYRSIDVDDIEDMAHAEALMDGKQ